MRPRRISRTAVALCTGVLCGIIGAGAYATGAGAVAARTSRIFTLADTGHLHLTSKHGFTLNEQGSASGNISGTIYIHLHIVSTNRVTAEVNIYPSGGSITGYGNANYHPSGSVATFNGTLNIARAPTTSRQVLSAMPRVYWLCRRWRPPEVDSVAAEC